VGWILGVSLSFLANPIIWLAAFFVSKNTPRESKFWIKFFLAIPLCVLAGVLFGFFTSGYDYSDPTRSVLMYLYGTPLSLLFCAFFGWAVRSVAPKKREEEDDLY